MHAVFHFNNGRDDLKGTNYSRIKVKYWNCGIRYEKGNVSYWEKWAIEFICKLRFTQIYTNGGNSELKEEMELFLWRTEREFVGSSGKTFCGKLKPKSNATDDVRMVSNRSWSLFRFLNDWKYIFG